MKYIALPQELYAEVRRYIGQQPYEIVKDLIAAIDKYAATAEMNTETEKPADESPKEIRPPKSARSEEMKESLKEQIKK